MAAFLKAVCAANVELSPELRNLLSVAYKNLLGQRRNPRRVLSAHEQRESAKGNEQRLSVIRRFQRKVEDELRDICTEIINILDDHLIPNAKTTEGQVFLYKMKGDYHRPVIASADFLRNSSFFIVHHNSFETV